MNLNELKSKTSPELLAKAVDLGIEDAGLMRRQDMIFAILKKLAETGVAISGEGVLEVMPDGFGF